LQGIISPPVSLPRLLSVINDPNILVLNRFFITTLFLLVLFRFSSFSQTENEGELSIESKSEQLLTTSVDEQSDLSQLADAYIELLEKPVNINKSDYEELVASGLFTDLQIEALLNHRETYGRLLALSELMLVPHFDVEFIRSVSPLITTGIDVDQPNAGLKRMLKDGKHTIVFRTGFIPEMKRGFKDEGDGPRYTGDPFGLQLRYKFNFMRKLSYSFVAEKDEGESFGFRKGRRGFDFYSGHVALRDAGLFRMIAIGDYQIGYGQGLVINGAFGAGVSADPVSINSTGQGIRPYSSSGESFFKRGLAVSVGKRRLIFDGFISYKKLDANLVDTDSLENDVQFSSFQTSGLHRTESELNDKNALTEVFMGFNLRYRTGRYRAGVTGYGSAFDILRDRESEAYSQFYFRGKRSFGIGADYSFILRNINLFGETAIDMNGVPATLNGVVLSVDPKAAFSVLYRHFPVTYSNIYSGPFRKSSKVQNESGLYAGLTFKPTKLWSLLLSYDQFRFPWLKYRIDAPSGGSDLSCQIQYSPSRNTQLIFRYIVRMSDAGFEDNPYLTSRIGKSVHRGYRFHFSSKVSSSFSIRTRAEFIRYASDLSVSNGFMIYQDINYHPMNSRWKLNIRYVMMDTDDYDSRIYAYENDVLYSFSISSYSDAGSRLICNVRFKFTRSMDVWFRYAATFYSNKEAVGSGWDEIEGNRKSDLKLQIRYEF
jgi:hypothetical protein